MKTLDDIKRDMSALYDQVRDDATELKKASEMANIAGKYLKAHQLELAERIFLAGRPKGEARIPGDVSDATLLEAASPH